MDEKSYIRNQLKTILKFYGLKENNSNWDCLSERHSNNKNKVTVRDDYCCCHCGIKGDVFNVISELEGINDFPGIYKRAQEILNIDNEKIDYKRYTKKENKKQVEEKKNLIKAIEYNLEVLNNNINNYNEYSNYNYFNRRGINRKEIFDKNKIIVSSPKNIIPSIFYSNKIHNFDIYSNIIPIFENGKVVNCILRRNDYNKMAKFSKLKVLSLSNLPLKIYNADILKKELSGFIYITEGIFDCFSFENEKRQAISINSITMRNRLFDIINKNKDKYKNAMFIISFDFDTKGKINHGLEAARDLHKKLKDMNLNSKILKIQDYKDVNEFYVNDKAGFRNKLNKLENTLKRIIYSI